MTPTGEASASPPGTGPEDAPTGWRLRRKGERPETRMFFDDDADLSLVTGKCIAVIGYGNQGRSQALNMRDQGLHVIVGESNEATIAQARGDGFDVYDAANAAARADIIFFLTPDEVQPEIYQRAILPHLKPGKILDFASGFNICFGFITPAPGVDVIMIAPRMIGKGVRDTFLAGMGFPSLIGIAQDASGRALDYTLALCKGIGSTKMGVVMSSFEEEAVLDIFDEHSSALYAMRATFEVLVEEYGFTPEAVLLEMYASGEGVSWAQAAVDLGFWHRLKLGSHTAQYGLEIVGRRYFDEQGTKQAVRKRVEYISSGEFAKEWMLERAAGMPMVKRMRERNLAHPMIEIEDRLYKALGRRPKS